MIMPRAICLTSDSIMDPIVVQQYDKDSRTVQLTVYETPGVLYDLTERSADVLYRVNGVNTPAYEARIVGENAVEFTVPGNIARNEGNCVVQVRFYHGEELLHTQLIPLIVRFSLTDGSGGEEDPTPAFVELLREARDAISQADAATANATEAANEANAAAEGLEEAKSAALNAASEAASEAAAARQAAVYANDAGTAAGEAKVDASQAAQAAIAAAEAAATQTNLARGATEEAINATTATRGATEEAGRQALNAMNAAEAANEAATTANTAANNADVQAESAANATMRALTAAGKPPIVNPATGTWRIWDDGAQAYKETTYRAQGPEGTRGFTPTITATRQEYGVLLHIENENSTETQMLYDGEDGKIDMNLQDGIAEGSVKIVGSKDEAEGYPIGKYATSFAFDGTAGGDYSHTEGLSTRAAGVAAHAEGNGSHASGDYSHAENESAATGRNSHAENKGSAEAENSHAEGLGTVASSMNQHAQGRYNVADDADIYAHIVGNGTSNADRSNAHTLDWNGNAWYAGNVYAGDVPSEANRLVRRSEMATGGGGIAGSGEPYQHMVTDINGNGKWEPREFYTAGGRRALMDGANLGTVGTIYTQIDASQLKELPEAGKSYVVVWKGKEYEVEPYAMTSGTLWIPMTGATEDVPFQFTISHNNGMITKVMVKAYESTDNVVCSIYEEMPEIIVKLPPKYLPEGGVGYEDTDYVEVVDTVWEKEGDVHSGITLDTPLNMNLGEKYRVTWNGEVYETEVTEYAAIHGFGNMGSFSGIETAEPFAVVCFPEDVPDMENAPVTVFIVKGEDTRPVALKIEHMQHVVHKIDPKFLPEGVGGGGADWNAAEGEPGYIANKPPEGGYGWTEEDGGEVVLDVSWTEELYEQLGGELLIQAPPIKPLEDLTTYMFTINGVEYEATTESLTMEGMTAVCAGNLPAMLGTGDNGFPFLYVDYSSMPEMVGNGIYGAMLLLETPDSFPIVLTIREGAVTHGIDPKYLPKGGFGYSEETVTEKALFEGTITQEEWDTYDGGVSKTEEVPALIEGNTYRVLWPDGYHECKAITVTMPDVGTFPVIGNTSLLSIGEDTGEPFAIAYVHDVEQFASQGICTIVSLPVPTTETFPLDYVVLGEEKTEIIHTIDKKYLPSSGGSGMKITITKDESGNYMTDTRLVDVYDMTAAELQAAITVHDDRYEMAVYGLSKWLYGGSVPALVFYVTEASDNPTQTTRRMSWMGNEQIDMIGPDPNFEEL